MTEPIEPRPPKATRSAARRRLVPARFDWAPGWIQALAAILTLVLGVITAWGLLGTGDPPAPTAGASATPGTAELEAVVILEGWEEVGADLVLFGTFENVNLGTDAIYLMGKPRTQEGPPFTTLRADATALETFPVNLANGEWQFVRPPEYRGFAWQAGVYDRPFGSNDVLAELREHGPEAEGIDAVSEVVTPPD